MITYEIKSLSNQLKELEEKLKVIHFVSVIYVLNICIRFGNVL